MDEGRRLVTAGGRTIRAGGRTVEIHRPSKVLFPGDGFTKGDLADYYRGVARRMVPQVRGRPLMLERHPGGIDDHGFIQKDVPRYFPRWVHRVELPKQEGGTVTYAVCDDKATLVYLADQACITPHRFLSTAGHPDRPDRLIVDLDPAGHDFGPVRTAALLLRDLLDDLGLPSTVMTTGSRGLHVVVPLDARAGFDETRAFARDLATLLAARHPDTLTTETRKQARRGRLYLDVQRNAYAQTAVAPYAVRALPGAPVAAPLTWEDVEDPDLTPRRWTIDSVDELLKGNPWRHAPRGRSLAPAREHLDAMLREE
ncbi:non-homologous end-joining DNA ligase [Actinacidiphila rubida]|uniref:Bifunctional non-homologous end joining protein LigD n=1 Tax=Actinacidiphila rubida TaxID=310780 RepID=A0A1H8SNE7_9ACTN|nr:non-homologous end-joining DNA ligase [Actinacidiphila rubida]SEO80499.1 bifunctional non-homologous end joining protein LigD [Actinacidiphila rubida]